ncbi:hypothetical protein RQP46_004441 [Phenoliferia psychrophenolica]
MSETASPTKRPAEDEVPEAVEAKKYVLPHFASERWTRDRSPAGPTITRMRTHGGKAGTLQHSALTSRAFSFRRAKAVEETPVVAEKKTEAVAEPEAAAPEEEADDEDVGNELAHLDTKNIIEGRRTRGKKIDYAALDQGDEDEDEEDEDAQIPEDAEEEPAESDEEESDAE